MTAWFRGYTTPTKSTVAATVEYAVQQARDKFGDAPPVYLLLNPADEIGLTVPMGAEIVTNDPYRLNVPRGQVRVVVPPLEGA